VATIASKAFFFHNSYLIAEASCRAETTIALSVTRPVGATIFFDLQLRNASESSSSIFFMRVWYLALSDLAT
jgi:hypothetical protein